MEEAFAHSKDVDVEAYILDDMDDRDADDSGEGVDVDYDVSSLSNFYLFLFHILFPEYNLVDFPYFDPQDRHIVAIVDHSNNFEFGYKDSNRELDSFP